MRQWIRSDGRSCGICATRVPEGNPLQVIQLTGMKRVMYRCPDHANSEVPPMLPAKMERVNTAKMIKLSHGAPRDWKYKQANDHREPGCGDE